jgi:hypothetical protein
MDGRNGNDLGVKELLGTDMGCTNSTGGINPEDYEEFMKRLGRLCPVTPVRTLEVALAVRKVMEKGVL